MKKYVRFTEDEHKIIIEEVKKCPTNLQNAFKLASKRLRKKTKQQVQSTWYQCLRKKPDVKAITVGSRHGFTQNVKNVKRNAAGEMPEQNLNSVQWLMKQMLELTPRERKAIIAFFSL